MKIPEYENKVMIPPRRKVKLSLLRRVLRLSDTDWEFIEPEKDEEVKDARDKSIKTVTDRG